MGRSKRLVTMCALAFGLACSVATAFEGGEGFAPSPRGRRGMGGGQGFGGRHGAGGGQDRMQRRGPHGGMRGPRQGILHLRKELELTDEQVAKIQEIVKKSREDVERGAGREDREALRKAIEAGDEAAVRAAVDKIAQAMADRAIRHMKVREEVHAVLTTEQLKKLEEIKAEHQKRRAEQRERMKEMLQRRLQELDQEKDAE